MNLFFYKKNREKKSIAKPCASFNRDDNNFFEKFISFKILQRMQNLFHPCSILSLPPLYVISKSIISIPSTLFRNKIWGFRKCLMKIVKISYIFLEYENPQTYFCFLFHFVLYLIFSLVSSKSIVSFDEFFIKHKNLIFGEWVHSHTYKESQLSFSVVL